MGAVSPGSNQEFTPPSWISEKIEIEENNIQLLSIRSKHSLTEIILLI
jgi:hypothetical protein